MKKKNISQTFKNPVPKKISTHPVYSVWKESRAFIPMLSVETAGGDEPEGDQQQRAQEDECVDCPTLHLDGKEEGN